MIDLRKYDDVSFGFEMMRQQKFVWSRELLVEPPKKQQNSPPPRVEDIASEIYTRLPREIRNRVYAYCVQGSYDNEVIVRRTAIGTTRRFAHLIRQPCGQHSYQWIEDPTAIQLSAQGLGVDVARELLECYYWTRTFKFAHHELCLLKSFLETDGFGLGMIPAHYARRLHIHIQPLDFAFLLPDKRLFEEQRYCKTIEALAIIKTGNSLVDTGPKTASKHLKSHLCIHNNTEYHVKEHQPHGHTYYTCRNHPSAQTKIKIVTWFNDIDYHTLDTNTS